MEFALLAHGIVKGIMAGCFHILSRNDWNKASIVIWPRTMNCDIMQRHDTIYALGVVFLDLIIVEYIIGAVETSLLVCNWMMY